MDYDLLKKVISQKGYTIKEFAQGIEMSDTGFHKAVKANSFSVEKLELAAKFLKVPIMTFFGSDTTESTENPENFYGKAWRDKYYTLLEKHTLLLEESNQVKKKGKK